MTIEYYNIIELLNGTKIKTELQVRFTEQEGKKGMFAIVIEKLSAAPKTIVHTINITEIKTITPVAFNF